MPRVLPQCTQWQMENEHNVHGMSQNSGGATWTHPLSVYYEGPSTYTIYTYYNICVCMQCKTFCIYIYIYIVHIHSNIYTHICYCTSMWQSMNLTSTHATTDGIIWKQYVCLYISQYTSSVHAPCATQAHACMPSVKLLQGSNLFQVSLETPHSYHFNSFHIIHIH